MVMSKLLSPLSVLSCSFMSQNNVTNFASFSMIRKTKEHSCAMREVSIEKYLSGPRDKKMYADIGVLRSTVQNIVKVSRQQKGR